MKQYFFLVFVMVTFVLINNSANSQNPPCAPNFPYVTYNTPFITEYPPYSLSMPYDVLIAYIALDSVSHYGNYWDVQQFLKRQVFNDTLQKIMHYFYQMVDYDPIRFFQTTEYWIPDSSIKVTLNEIKSLIYDQVKKQSPHSLLDYMLMRTDYILQIKAVNINVIHDTSTSGPANEVREITFEVLDTIKGKNIPFKSVIAQEQITNEEGKSQLSSGYKNISIFQYCPRWANLIDSQGQPWIKQDSVYIVFLKNIALCDDINTGSYYNLRPVWTQSVTFGMYPVINGFIKGSDTDFKFEAQQTIEEFKAKLRLRINEICSY